MTTMPRRLWQDMTTLDFAALEAARVIAVLPVGAIEQHGPHLPVSTDACINQGVLARALELMPDDLPVTVLPMLPVGKSNEHLAFPGTLTLSAETLIRVWTEIGEGVARAGIRKLVLFNSHGGQLQIMDIVARDLRVRHAMMVVAYSWFAGGLPAGLFGEDEVRHGIHAGAIETSMMLHLAPDLVRQGPRGGFSAPDGRPRAGLPVSVAYRCRPARLDGPGPPPEWRLRRCDRCRCRTRPGPGRACGPRLDRAAPRDRPLPSRATAIRTRLIAAHHQGSPLNGASRRPAPADPRPDTLSNPAHRRGRPERRARQPSRRGTPRRGPDAGGYAIGSLLT